MKKVTISTKPQAAHRPASSDDWVTKRQLGGEMKRLTIDVPKGLHKRIKSQCAIRGVQMADALRDLLEKEFPEEYQERDGTRATGSANQEIR